MRAHHVGLGAKYPGKCLACGRLTGARSHELEATSLYKRDDGKFAVAHPECVGGRVKHRVGGGSAYRTEPESSVEVAHA